MNRFNAAIVLNAPFSKCEKQCSAEMLAQILPL